MYRMLVNGTILRVHPEQVQVQQCPREEILLKLCDQFSLVYQKYSRSSKVIWSFGTGRVDKDIECIQEALADLKVPRRG